MDLEILSKLLKEYAVMVIFLSWSGDKSLKVAKALRDWLPNIIQSIDPWLSETDIKKGEMWMSAISEKLGNTDIGVICVTNENLEKPWLLFEAGALSKSMGMVCTLLIDVEPINIKAPLNLFQATIAKEKEDMLKLIKTINDKLEVGKLTDDRLEQSFEKWWLDFNVQLENINSGTSKKEVNEGVKTPSRTDRELLEEVLIILRDSEIQRNEKNKNDVYLAAKIRANSESALKDEYYRNVAYKDGLEKQMKFIEYEQNSDLEKKKRTRLLGNGELPERVLRDLLNQGLSESVIIQTMQELGAPMSWILNQLHDLKSKDINSVG